MRRRRSVARRRPRPIVSGTSCGTALSQDLSSTCCAGEHRPARADQRVAAAQVQAEPRRLQALDHGVEPERDLGELDGGGVEVDAVDLVQREVRLHLLQLARVLVRVDASRRARPGGASGTRSASWRTASIANAPEPSAGSQTVSSRISAAVVRRAVLVEQLLERLARRRTGSAPRACSRTPTAAAPGRRAGTRRCPAACSTGFVSPVTGSVVVTKSLAAMPSARSTGHHPGALLGVAVLGHLVEVGLGEEAGVGHQALVDRAELVDAELGVGDEAAVACPRVSLLSSRCRSTCCSARVAEPDLVDERGRLRPEQVGSQRAERRARRAPLVGVASASRVVALVDQPEQHAERVVEVRARCGLRRGQLDQGELAQPVEAVALRRTPARPTGSTPSSGDASAYSRNRMR